MSGRLSEVEQRIASVHQLASVITAMRGIAASRSREARLHLDAIRAYAETVSEAIGSALAFLPDAGTADEQGPSAGRNALVVLCAEQGFAGAFSERVLDAAEELIQAEGKYPPELLLVGDRGRALAELRDLDVTWSAPMAAHSGQVASLANQVLEALYERLEDGRVTGVTVLHVLPDAVETLAVTRKILVPFDFRRFHISTSLTPPLLNLQPRTLLAGLVEEYVFAELCEALMLSYSAENDARMRAMIVARDNVDKTLEDLVASARRLRQEEITEEIIELAAGAGLEE